MTTKELVIWAYKAAEERESSWSGEKYKLSITEATNCTKPSDATNWEADIVACFLSFQHWNEVQDWYSESTQATNKPATK